MAQKISAVHERVDDIPVIIALLLKMRVVELIDRHFPTNGNRTGLSLGRMCLIWLTFILTKADRQDLGSLRNRSQSHDHPRL